MNVDRELQRALLEVCKNAFPEYVDPDKLSVDGNTDHAIANLVYLEGHGLLELISSHTFGGLSVAGAKITVKGIDFLADDGGLSAILGVVTVKLHEDTLKALLVERIEKSDGDASVKGELIKQVKALPAEGLKTLTTKVLEAGLAALPNAIGLLHTWLSHA